MADSGTRAPKRSDLTRAAIAEAAQAAFGSNGFERTTIRHIAAVAKVDPALVMRYFGSKDELFAAVAHFDLNLPDLTAVKPSRIGQTLAAHYVDLWEGGGAARGGLPLLLRSAASNPVAAGRVREMFRAQVVPAIAAIEADLPAAERAGLVASQLLGIALCRYLLRIPPLVAMSRETLVRETGAALQRYVTGRPARKSRTSGAP